MKNKILLSLSFLLCLLLTACGHKHTFSEATCTTPMTCSECGVTEGTELEHSWVDASCETAKTCSVCGTTEGNPLEHSWIDATTETPKTCELCGLTDGEPLVEEVIEEDEPTEVVDEDTPLEEDGCNNTIPEDEVQWYLDTLGLTREQFNKMTNAQIEQMIMDWVSSGYTGGGNSSGGSSGGNSSGGGSTPGFTEDGGLDEGDSLPPLELGDPSEAPEGYMSNGGDNDLPTAPLGNPEDTIPGTM